jgi:fluoroquinolone resistance protein
VADRADGPATPASVVSDADWYARDLTGEATERTTFLRADLSEAVSDTGTVFADCLFRDTRFNSAVFTAAAFLNCTFTGCNFFAARFIDCKFVGSMFERCDFGQFTVLGGDWSFVGLPGADLRKVTMRSVRMREADLTGARCDGATLRDLDLAGARAGKTRFAAADLRGSDLTALDPWSVDLAQAIIDWQQAVTIAANLGLDVRTDET